MQVKYRIRSFLLGKYCKLVGNNYNTKREHCQKHHFQKTYSVPSNTYENESLDSELMLSVMIFSCHRKADIDIPDEGNKSFNVEDGYLAECTELEGLRYFGGFVARKFPQYVFLGLNVTANDNTWLGEISWAEEKLLTPTTEFYEQLKLMEKLFNCYHGEKSLKPYKKYISNLSQLCSTHVNLPKDVVQYFIKCRIFFRMRRYDRSYRNSKCIQRKMNN